MLINNSPKQIQDYPKGRQSCLWNMPKGDNYVYKNSLKGGCFIYDVNIYLWK